MANHVLIQFPDFRKLFIARLISCIGDKFYTIALAWWILSTYPDDGKLKLSLLMAVNVLPVVVFGPLMGTLTDRLNKKHCMIAADIIRAVLLLCLTYMMFTQHISMAAVYIISFLQALTGPLFDTATQSSISTLTDKEYTPAAVSMNSSVTQVAAVLGALLGSMLIHWIGVGGAILFNALSYVVSLFFVLAIRTPLLSAFVREPFLLQFKEGFRYLSQHPPIYSLLITFSVLNLFFAPIMLILPIMVKDVLHMEANILALFEASLASGAVLMTVYLSFKAGTSSIYAKLCLATVCMGLSMAGMGLTDHIGVIMALLFTIGLMLSYTNATAMALFQNEVPYEVKGRFFAVLYTVAFAVMPFSYMLVGLVLQYLNTGQLLFICGSAMVAIAIALYKIPRIAN